MFSAEQVTRNFYLCVDVNLQEPFILYETGIAVDNKGQWAKWIAWNHVNGDIYDPRLVFNLEKACDIYVYANHRILRAQTAVKTLSSHFKNREMILGHHPFNPSLILQTEWSRHLNGFMTPAPPEDEMNVLDLLISGHHGDLAQSVIRQTMCLWIWKRWKEKMTDLLAAHGRQQITNDPWVSSGDVLSFSYYGKIVQRFGINKGNIELLHTERIYRTIP